MDGCTKRGRRMSGGQAITHTNVTNLAHVVDDDVTVLHRPPLVPDGGRRGQDGSRVEGVTERGCFRHGLCHQVGAGGEEEVQRLLPQARRVRDEAERILDRGIIVADGMDGGGGGRRRPGDWSGCRGLGV